MSGGAFAPLPAGFEVLSYRRLVAREEGLRPREICIVCTKPGGDAWVVIDSGDWLVRTDGGTRWEYAPAPSGREPGWVERATFTLNEAVAAVEAQLVRDAEEDARWKAGRR